MKYKVLYDTTIATKIYKKDEVVELDDKTDRNFIKRLEAIKAIVEISSDYEVKQPKKATPKASK